MTKSDAALASATASDAARFFNHVDRSGECWEWRGALLPNGYGKFGLHGVVVTAHRFALAMKLGHPPRHQAIHSCDNPSCVNPAHLRDGTQVENMADARERGRAVPPPSPLGRTQSAANRAKLSAIKTGIKRGPLSAEHRAKIGAASRGRKASPETRAKMAVARRAYWERKGSAA